MPKFLEYNDLLEENLQYSDTTGVYPWISETSYSINDVVWNPTDKKIYVCTTANSDATFTASKWQILSEGDYVTVANTVERDALYKEDGIIVYVQADERFYRLESDLITWTTLIMSAAQIKYCLCTLETNTLNTVEDFLRAIGSAGTIIWTDPFLEDNGDGTVKVYSGSGMIRNETKYQGAEEFKELCPFDWVDLYVAVPINSVKYIGFVYNAVNDRVEIEARDTDIWDEHTEFALGSAVRLATLDICVLPNPRVAGDIASHMQRRFFFTKRFEYSDRFDGLQIGETGTRNITVSGGYLFDRVSEFTFGNFDSSGSDTFCTFLGATLETQAETQWPNIYWNDGGVKTELLPNKYASLWFYSICEAPGTESKTLVMLYGTTENASLAGARSEQPPSTIPLIVEAHGKLIGRILFQKSDTVAQDIESAFKVTFNGTAATSHNGLSGIQGGTLNEYYHLSSANYTDLTDGGATTLHKHSHSNMDDLNADDHTQYLNTTRHAAITGNPHSTNHNALNNIDLAATGKTYGHIDDQAQTVDGAKTLSELLTLVKGLIVNSSGDDHDFIVKGLADDLLINTDAANDKVGFGIVPSWKVTIATADSVAGLVACNTSGDARFFTYLSSDNGQFYLRNSANADKVFLDSAGISVLVNGLAGSFDASENLDLHSTSHGTKGNINMNDNVDFLYNQALRMVLHKGLISALPNTGSEVSGQVYYASDIKTLFVYEGGWAPGISFAGVTLYVDGTSGTDAIGKGYGSGTDACETIQYAFNLIPALSGGNVVINVAAGTYDEELALKGKSFSGPYTLTIQGELNEAEASQALTSGTKQGGTNTWGTVTVTGAGWTIDEFVDKLLYIENEDYYFPIFANTADTITIHGRFTNNPPTGNFTIYDWAGGTILTNTTASTYGLQVTGVQDVFFKGCKFESDIFIKLASVQFEQVFQSTTSIERPFAVSNFAVGSAYSCIFHGSHLNLDLIRAVLFASLQTFDCRYINKYGSFGNTEGIVAPGVAFAQISGGSYVYGFNRGMRATAGGVVGVNGQEPRVTGNDEGMYANLMGNFSLNLAIAPTTVTGNTTFDIKNEKEEVGYLQYTGVGNTSASHTFYAEDSGNNEYFKTADDGGIHVKRLKSGATAAAAGAATGELWVTSGHATLPNGVVMQG